MYIDRINPENVNNNSNRLVTEVNHMSKFHKRDNERKGTKKHDGLEDKLIKDNLDDLKSDGGEVSD